MYTGLNKTGQDFEKKVQKQNLLMTLRYQYLSFADFLVKNCNLNNALKGNSEANVLSLML